MRTVALLLLALSACKQQKPALTGAEIRNLERALPGLNGRCLDKIRAGGVQALPMHVEEDCFELEATKQWVGYWRLDFEESSFCASLAPECFYGAEQGLVWLVPAKNMAGPQLDQSGGIYAVRFVGRRTRFPGLYGHSGGSIHAIILDRILSLTKVEIPRSAFKGGSFGPWRPCMSAGNCINAKIHAPN
jgi:hypothetical protein